MLRRAAERAEAATRTVPPSGPIPQFKPTLPGPEQFKSWVVFDLPVTRISHPGNNMNAATTTRYDPKVQIAVAYGFATSRLSLTSSVDWDRYANAPDAEGNTILSTLKWEFNTVKDATYTPYLVYQSGLAFDNSFGTEKRNQNDAGAGMKLKVTGTQLFSTIDVNATRRIVHIGSNSSAVTLKTNSSVDVIEKVLSVSLTPSFRYRRSDSGQRDKTVNAPLALAWDPPAFKDIGLEITLSASANRNYSSNPAKNSRQWEAGPTLEIGFQLL